MGEPKTVVTKSRPASDQKWFYLEIGGITHVDADREAIVTSIPPGTYGLNHDGLFRVTYPTAIIVRLPLEMKGRHKGFEVVHEWRWPAWIVDGEVLYPESFGLLLKKVG